MLLAVGMCGVDLDHSTAPSQCWGQGGEGGTQPSPTPLTAWGGWWVVGKHLWIQDRPGAPCLAQPVPQRLRSN